MDLFVGLTISVTSLAGVSHSWLAHVASVYLQCIHPCRRVETSLGGRDFHPCVTGRQAGGWAALPRGEERGSRRDLVTQLS